MPMTVQQRLAYLERRVEQLERERDAMVARVAAVAAAAFRVGLFRLTAPLAKGGSATAYLLDLSSGGDVVDAVANQTVHDLIESFVGGSGKYGIAVWCFNRWVVVQLQC